MVLDTLRGLFGDQNVLYWRNKSGREVDFVVRKDRDRVDVVECTINPDRLDSSGIGVFRASYAKRRNYVVSPAAKRHYDTCIRNLRITVCDTPDLANLMGLPDPSARYARRRE
ncbi:MAG: hypothetical protein OXN97_20990 [Bryobacterales bacterium]|nr:hypothetical protein [Bryobacterales bacterium]